MSTVKMIDLTRTIEARKRRPDWESVAVFIAAALAIGWAMKGLLEV